VLQKLLKITVGSIEKDDMGFDIKMVRGMVVVSICDMLVANR